jgi:hypothetical protein
VASGRRRRHHPSIFRETGAKAKTDPDMDKHGRPHDHHVRAMPWLVVTLDMGAAASGWYQADRCRMPV